MKRSTSWDELIENPTETKGGMRNLGSIPPEVASGGHLEITLAYPQTDSFCNASSDKQKKLYSKLFNDMMNAIPFEYRVTAKYVFEFFKSGHIHLHGYIKLHPDRKFFIVGLLADVAKKWHSLLPVKKYQRYHLYNGKNLYSDYDRYKAPSICLQWRSEDAQRDQRPALESWIEYMNKAQLEAPSSPHLQN